MRDDILLPRFSVSDEGPVEDAFRALEAEGRGFLLQMLRSRAFRERAAVRLFREGLAFAPDEDCRARLVHDGAEEEAHYDAVARLWARCAQEPRATLDAWTEARAAGDDVPHAQSWVDIALAQWLYDRAGLFQLREVATLPFTPYAKLAAAIVADETGHGEHGLASLEALADKTDRDRLMDGFARWLRVALLSFGRPKSPQAARALALGWRRRLPEDVQADFLADIAPAVQALGLGWPTSLGLTLPAGVGPPAASPHPPRRP